jgi:aspartate aminotransferase-like enzyme
MTRKNALPYRLRLPGPTAVPERVQKAIAGPALNHRGPEFTDIVKSAVSLAQPVLGTNNDVMFFASSGTGMMEAALANALGEGERALVLSYGAFGERFSSIAEALGIQTEQLEAPWGETIPARQVEEKLRAGNFHAVVVVHNESSTGAVSDLETLGKVVGATDAILIVDSVSGLGGVEMRQDDWGVDILVSASQKALMCPPGLGLASISDKAWDRVEQEAGKKRYYWDFRKARESAAKGQTAFTTPVTLMSGLNEALSMIHEEGLDNVLRRHERLSDAFRAGGHALGLSDFTRAAIKSNTVVVFSMPEGVDGNAVVAHMYDHYNTVIAGARNWLSGKVIRIGTMGFISNADIETDLKYLESTMHSLSAFTKNG